MTGQIISGDFERTIKRLDRQELITIVNVLLEREMDRRVDAERRAAKAEAKNAADIAMTVQRWMNYARNHGEDQTADAAAAWLKQNGW